MGVEIEGALEPSHTLIDKVAQMVDDGVVKYIAWDECTTREDELAGVKKDKFWKADAQGFLKEATTDAPSRADISDLRLKLALQRRAIAFELGALCSYEVHEHWANKLIAEYLRPARSEEHTSEL